MSRTSSPPLATAIGLAIVSFGMGLAASSARADDQHFRGSGTASAAGREFPAEIRVICDGPQNLDIQFAVIFRDGAEAAGSDSIFPFSVYEGPDGKAAPMAIEITSAAGPPTKMSVRSGAGWFGVENEYLFNLRLADAKRFLRQGATASKVTVTIASGAAKLGYAFSDAAATLGKAAAACK